MKVARVPRARRMIGWIGFLAVTGLLLAADVSRVRQSENERIAIIEKVQPAVVAVFGPGGQGGGSGVLIDADGYALTNFHVVAGAGPVMKCGLPDGVLYDAVLVGLDRVGDVALIKLLPKKEGTPFPFVPLGDSDTVREGDWSMAMGNPFLLATDFTPSVTFGLVSGVHRYQYPEGTLLEYTDCIQIDTSINPGNSGGPLFNMKGELIGINGRGSFDKRARINSGVGYAISINQIKNFLGHLHAGLDTDHASLGAIVASVDDDIPRLVVRDIIDTSDAHRRGLDVGDELISFAGRPMNSVNEFKNVLGIYPKDWRLPLEFRRQNERKEVLIRLQGVLPKETPNEDENAGRPRPAGPRSKPPIPDGPAKKLYVERKGFANYYFNELHQKRLWEAFRKHGEFTTFQGPWSIEGELELAARKTNCRLIVTEEKVGNEVHPLVKMTTDTTEYVLDPLKHDLTIAERTAPVGSGGMLMAVYQLRHLLATGLQGFGRNIAHGGHEPFYPPRPDGIRPRRLNELRVETEVLRTELAGTPVKWYFSRADHRLMGFEVFSENHADPCEIYFFDVRPVSGGQLPHRWEIRFGDNRFGVLTVRSYNLAANP